jgi:hypothetical protein
MPLDTEIGRASSTKGITVVVSDLLSSLVAAEVLVASSETFSLFLPSGRGGNISQFFIWQPGHVQSRDLIVNAHFQHDSTPRRRATFTHKAANRLRSLAGASSPPIAPFASEVKKDCIHV